MCKKRLRLAFLYLNPNQRQLVLSSWLEAGKQQRNCATRDVLLVAMLADEAALMCLHNGSSPRDVANVKRKVEGLSSFDGLWLERY
jgi:hypothetical protein